METPAWLGTETLRLFGGSEVARGAHGNPPPALGISGKGEEVHIYFQLSPMCVIEEVSLDDPTVLIWL